MKKGLHTYRNYKAITLTLILCAADEYIIIIIVICAEYVMYALPLHSHSAISFPLGALHLIEHTMHTHTLTRSSTYAKRNRMQ